MKSALLLSVFLFTTVLVTPAQSMPMGIDHSKIYEKTPEIEGFRRWYGDVNYGLAVYLGTKDVSGFETELHLHFSGKKISKALFIFGPSGISSQTCLKDYKKIVKILDGKYGHHTHQHVIKDPLIEDLVKLSPCSSVKNGLLDVYTFWKLADHLITATLIGDDEGYYIEIEYKYSSCSKRDTKELQKAL